MGTRDKQVLDKILVFDCRCTPSGPATALRLVISERLRFRVAAMRNRHYAIFLGNQILNR